MGEKYKNLKVHYDTLKSAFEHRGRLIKALQTEFGDLQDEYDEVSAENDTLKTLRDTHVKRINRLENEKSDQTDLVLSLQKEVQRLTDEIQEMNRLDEFFDEWDDDDNGGWDFDEDQLLTSNEPTFKYESPKPPENSINLPFINWDSLKESIGSINIPARETPLYRGFNFYPGSDPGGYEIDRVKLNPFTFDGGESWMRANPPRVWNEGADYAELNPSNVPNGEISEPELPLDFEERFDGLMSKLMASLAMLQMLNRIKELIEEPQAETSEQTETPEAEVERPFWDECDDPFCICHTYSTS
jgi:hypothetical protein